MRINLAHRMTDKHKNNTDRDRDEAEERKKPYSFIFGLTRLTWISDGHLEPTGVIRLRAKPGDGIMETCGKRETNTTTMTVTILTYIQIPTLIEKRQ